MSIVADWLRTLFRPPRNERPPDTLMHLSALDWLHLGQVFSHIFIIGQTGSAKTTGVGAHLAYGLLESGMGGMILCAKQDEAERWIGYATKTGRSADVLHVTVDGPCLDILNYELSSRGGSPESAAALLEVILQVQNRGRKAGNADPYFINAATRMMRYGMQLMRMNDMAVSLSGIYEFCNSLPTSPEQLRDAEFVKRSMALQLVLGAAGKYEHDRAFKVAAAFVCDEWPNLAEKTRSSVHSEAVVTLDKLLSGPFARLISNGKSEWTPDQALTGRLIILDLPVDLYREPAQWAQIAYKMLLQRAAMRRTVTPEMPGAFLFADEAQVFLAPDVDTMFQAVARQYKLGVINISQNLPLTYTALGGGKEAESQAQAWISNHATVICCANTDKETNEHFSRMFGQSRHLFFGGGGGGQHDYDPFLDFMGQGKPGLQMNFHEQLHYDVPPEAFSRLKKGGSDNGMTMEAYVMQSGRRFSNGKPWLKGTWQQRF